MTNIQDLQKLVCRLPNHMTKFKFKNLSLNCPKTHFTTSLLSYVFFNQASTLSLTRDD